MKIDNVETIKDLARGAVLLGTGGGGDPYVGQLLLQQEVREGRFVEVVAADELDDDAVSGIKIKDGAVNAPDLADSAVTAGKISKKAVTEDTIDDDAVTDKKIKANVSMPTMPLLIEAMKRRDEKATV